MVTFKAHGYLKMCGYKKYMYIFAVDFYNIFVFYDIYIAYSSTTAIFQHIIQTNHHSQILHQAYQ